MKRLLQPIARFGDALLVAGLHVVQSLPGVGKIFARYEAAYTNWGARRWLWHAYQDARFELDWGQTMEITRKHVYFCENNAVVRRIEWLRCQYAAGVSGLQVTPDASDATLTNPALEQWNRQRKKDWDAFCRSPDISNNLTMGQLTLLWERQLFRVGNIIVLKTMDENGELAIQTVDRLRLQTPTQFAAEEGKTVCQGIRLKTIKVAVNEIENGKSVKKVKEVITGRPELYYIRDEFELDKFAVVKAENVIHRFDMLMPGQMTGIPDGHAVINLLHDFEDLQIMEMQASKLASEIATVERNTTGEKMASTARTSRVSIAGVDTSGNPTSKTALYDYNVTLGAKNIAMFHGDDINNFMVKRPTVAQQDYWDFLLNQICMGYNVPRLLVAPYSLQGTVTRADLAVARDAFRRDFAIVASVLREIYEWWSARQVRHNPRNYGQQTPADHDACEIHPPESPDVDVGYSANGLAIEMELGTTNIAQVCGRKGISWRPMVRQTAQIEAAIDAEAKAAGIDPMRISSKLFKTGRAVAMEETGDTHIPGEEGPGAGENHPEQKPEETLP